MEIDPEELFETFGPLPLSRKVGFVFRETLALHDCVRKELCPFIATSYRPPYKKDLARHALRPLAARVCE